MYVLVVAMQIQTELTLIFTIDPDVVVGGRRRGCVNSLKCDMQVVGSNLT